MKFGRILVLAVLWTATLSLFALSSTRAQTAAGEPDASGMTGSEVGYRTVTRQSIDGIDCVRVSGCLSERDIADAIKAFCKNRLSPVTVKAEKDNITVGAMIADKDKTAVSDAAVPEMIAVIADAAAGAPVRLCADVLWSASDGFTVSNVQISLYDMELPAFAAQSVAERITDDLTSGFEKAVKEQNAVITRLKLLPGRMYYECLVPDGKNDKG